jgi:membrane AbrB-like protein
VSKAVCLAACLAAAVLGQWTHLPLPWVLGPLLVTAGFSLMGLPVFAPQSGRRLGQIVVGTSVGLFVSLDVLARLSGALPAVILTALVAIIVCTLVGLLFARLADVDSTTAFFATTPAGMSEMSRIGELAGGRVDVIALTQAIRVATVVLVLPAAVIALRPGSAMAVILPAREIDYLTTIGLVLAGVAGALLMRAIRFDNPWTIGAVVAVGAIAAAGLVEGRLPRPAFWGGQFLIGIAVGSRFRRDVVRRLPRVCLAALATALLTLGLMTGYALLLTRVTGIDLVTGILGASPGGLAEMSVTAQLLQVDVALVVAFHVFRSFFVNGFSGKLYRLLVRLRLLG